MKLQAVKQANEAKKVALMDLNSWRGRRLGDDATARSSATSRPDLDRERAGCRFFMQSPDAGTHDAHPGLARVWRGSMELGRAVARSSRDGTRPFR
jgi:hypothetical protein